MTPATPGPQRTPAKRKARQLAKYLRGERPDYAYLKEVFQHLRGELGVEVTRAPKKLPYVPTEAEIRAFYNAVWKARRASDVVRLPYPDHPGQGREGPLRTLPVCVQGNPRPVHRRPASRRRAEFLFESSWKKPYSDRGVRQSLEIYSRLALAGAQQRYNDAIGDFPV